jgi:alkylation response protein AidB-like acyl-CoA dehydrogenase
VTGARHADVIVVGGTCADGRQILAAISTDRAGVMIGPPLRLLALTGSETGSVTLADVDVARDELIAGPAAGVVQQSTTGGAGSLTTSTLATGHAFGCLDLLQREATVRPSLEPIVKTLQLEANELRRELLHAASRSTQGRTPEQLRAHATDLALRASQALLTATKGAGFVAGHPAERLAREALFFLVWSCPQAVATQLLQNFSGCENGG